MSLSDVKFKINDGSLGRALEGTDHYSGLVIHLPNATANKFGLFYSLAEAEQAGITATASADAHYHIAQYFNQQPQGVLYFYAGADDVDDAVEALQAYALGNVKQVAVLDTAHFATATLQALQAKADLLADAHQELVILYAADFTTTSLSALPTLTTLACPNVAVVIGADVSGRSALGATLGTVSLATVAQSIAAVKFFNVVKGTEYDVLAFATGELYSAKTNAELNAVADKGYIFLRKYVGRTGSFFNSSRTATALTSDFSRIENVRTIQKAKRVIRFVLLPELNSPLFATKGILSELTLSKFELLIKNQLEAMTINQELTDFSITINPAQNVVSTNKLAVSVGLTPVGVAEQIEVGIGFQL